MVLALDLGEGRASTPTGASHCHEHTASSSMDMCCYSGANLNFLYGAGYRAVQGLDTSGAARACPMQTPRNPTSAQSFGVTSFSATCSAAWT